MGQLTSTLPEYYWVPNYGATAHIKKGMQWLQDSTHGFTHKKVPPHLSSSHGQAPWLPQWLLPGKARGGIWPNQLSLVLFMALGLKWNYKTINLQLPVSFPTHSLDHCTAQYWLPGLSIPLAEITMFPKKLCIKDYTSLKQRTYILETGICGIHAHKFSHSFRFFSSKT